MVFMCTDLQRFHGQCSSISANYDSIDDAMPMSDDANSIWDGLFTLGERVFPFW